MASTTTLLNSTVLANLEVPCTKKTTVCRTSYFLDQRVGIFFILLSHTNPLEGTSRNAPPLLLNVIPPREPSDRPSPALLTPPSTGSHTPQKPVQHDFEFDCVRPSFFINADDEFGLLAAVVPAMSSEEAPKLAIEVDDLVSSAV